MTKKILSIILVSIISFSLIIPVFEVGATALTSWDFNNTGNNEGWIANEYISESKVENGCYTLELDGGDSYITSPQLSFDSERFPKMELTYRNDTDDSNAEIFFTCSEGGWGAERGLGFSTIADGQWHTATIDLSQNSYYVGTITQLRFDPAENVSGTFEIDKIRFLPSTENADYWNFSVDGNTEQWIPNSDINSYAVCDSSLTMNFSGQADPFLINFANSIDTAIYNKFVLTYRNTTDCKTSELYWVHDGEDFSAERMKKIETINDGDWHHVIVDLSTEENWVDTVKALRFDPVEFTFGTFEIDRMVLASQNAPIDIGATNVVSAVSWDFTRNHQGIGWTECNNVVSTGVVDGAVFFNINAATDPYVYGPDMTIDSSVYKKLEIRYRNNIDNNEAQIFWKKESTDFNQADSMTFNLDNSGNWNNIILDFSKYSSWSDIISKLRFDFAHSGTGMIEIDKIRFISETESKDKVCTVSGGNNTMWNFMTDDNLEGWSKNSDVANYDVAHGNYVAFINGGKDPNITSPAINMDTEKYKIVEIKYKNEITNDDSMIYWESDNGGLSEQASCKFTSVADGVWHTVTLDMTDNPYWKGNITRLRVDPVSGGVGHYYIDQIAIKDAPSRYTMSNGYIYLSGVNGSIDTLKFDPDGTANYGENSLMGELYMGLKYNNTAYSSSCSDVNWTMKDNTLIINNITLGSAQLTGKWVIKLNGNKLDSTFTIKSYLSSDTTYYNLGYCYDMVWDNDGFEVEQNPAGSLRVPFSKIIGSDDRYHSAYAYKRMYSTEDEDTLGFRGSYVDIEGANGYNYNLRMSYDTGRISPSCFVDVLKLQFRGKESTVNIATGGTLTRTLGIEVTQNTDITPEHFVSFESSDEEFASALSQMLYEFGNSREASCTNPDWAEWISTIRAWQDDRFIESEKLTISSYIQQPDGYVYTWGNIPGWPFPVDRDANHYITTCANLINAVYNYYVYDGDEAFLEHNIPRIRLAVDFLLKQYDPRYNVFRIDQVDHNGTPASVGSNYWDIVPYGNLTAYDNIYGYLALTRMAEMERVLGETDRAAELDKYASDLKEGYNKIFWAGDHYIQSIDSNGVTHDYGCVYLNLEAITYGLADKDRAKVILDFMSNTNTSSGKPDVFSEFVFAPRATMFHNPSQAEGGWYCFMWGGGDAYGSEQIQNGGTIFYIAYYELMSRIKAYGADNTYDRLKEIIDRYNVEHLQGTLSTGQLNQHFTPGLVGCWGEFPENGLVPVAAKNGFMGIKADMTSLNITPSMPSDLESLTINRVNFRDMHLSITTTQNSVRIKATKNDNKYDDWFVNGKKVDGLFDVTIDIEKGETVSIYRASDRYEPGDVDRDGKITVEDATLVQRSLALFTELDDEQAVLADVDKDGCVSITDATYIQMYVAKLIDKLPV